MVRRKPYTNEASRAKRLNYVKTYQNTDIDFWKYVLWFDESKFNLLGSDRSHSKKNMIHNVLCQQLSMEAVVLKFGGCCTWHGVGNLLFINGNMIGDIYEAILKENLTQPAKKLNLRKNVVF